jgi:hypothetical protein
MISIFYFDFSRTEKEDKFKEFSLLLNTISVSFNIHKNPKHSLTCGREKSFV